MSNEEWGPYKLPNAANDNFKKGEVPEARPSPEDYQRRKTQEVLLGMQARHNGLYDFKDEVTKFIQEGFPREAITKISEEVIAGIGCSNSDPHSSEAVLYELLSNLLGELQKTQRVPHYIKEGEQAVMDIKLSFTNPSGKS